VRKQGQEQYDRWLIEMERPFVIPGKKTRPTPREVEVEADGFNAFYAQVTSK
jgi:hypothetical protein